MQSSGYRITAAASTWETNKFAQHRGIVSCFTPVSSPQSNGMTVSLVKTFERNYMYVHDRTDGQTV